MQRLTYNSGYKEEKNKEFKSRNTGYMKGYSK